jgi:membrane protein YdbS with pleckstrin-like domain
MSGRFGPVETTRVQVVLAVALLLCAVGLFFLAVLGTGEIAAIAAGAGVCLVAAAVVTLAQYRRARRRQR